MYPLTNAIAYDLFYSPDKDNNSKIVFNNYENDGFGHLMDYDISRFVSSFGTVSRSMEYDTGKFSPARHSFKIENSKDFGDYMFTLRQQINGKDVLGTDYWTDKEYDVYYSSADIHLYQGVINTKSEDRIKDTVKVSSNDAVKYLNEFNVATRNTTPDDAFQWYDTANTDTQFIQKEIKYGQHKLCYTSTTTTRRSCVCNWGSVSPYLYSIVDCTNHGLSHGAEVTISGTTNYNGTFSIIVESSSRFRIGIGSSGWAINQSGTLTIPTWTEERANQADPFSITVGVKNTYECVKPYETMGTVWNIDAVYDEPVSGGVSYVRTSVNHDLPRGSLATWITGTTSYNGHYDYFHVGGSISSFVDMGSGYVKLIHSMKLPSTGNWPIRIEDSVLGYNGNYAAVYLSSNELLIQTTFLGTEAVAYVVSRNLRAINASYVSNQTGYLHYGTYDVGWLWYFPIQNYVKTSDVLKVYYWDYIANMWCKFGTNNLTNANYGFVVERAAAGQGVYVRKRNTTAIASDDDVHDLKWIDDWYDYLYGTGSYYWSSSEPNPKLAIEFNGYVYYPNSVGMNCYANPSAVMWDLLSTIAGYSNGELDVSDFATLDYTHTFDYAAFYMMGGVVNWAAGGQINVSVTEEKSMLSLLQDISLTSGIMMTCSHIRTTDHRIRLIINRDYDNTTDNPAPAISWSTHNEITQLEIDSDNQFLKNDIFITNFIPSVSLPGAFEIIEQSSGNADKVLEIALDDKPICYWYNSNWYADRCATNFLNKLEDAWENVRILIDERGVIVELGDYVKIHDHKVNEYIVMQVYDWSFNLDTGSTSITGKKVYSSKD